MSESYKGGVRVYLEKCKQLCNHGLLLSSAMSRVFLLTPTAMAGQMGNSSK